MPRGGRRSTTWKPTWKHGKTRTIRVPIVLAESILNLARILDEGFPKYKNQEGFSDQSCLSSTNCLLSSLPDFLSPLGKKVSEDSLVTDKVESQNSLDTDNTNELIKKLNAFDVSASIEALTTAISMKQIAISKESKKRSKADTITIAKWEKEVESLERAGARSALLQAVRISQINLESILSRHRQSNFCRVTSI